MNDKDIIAERLRKARANAELKQIGGGAYGKVPQSTISTWERKPPGPLITLRKLVQRYETNADYILGLTDKKEPYPRDALPEDVQEIADCMAQMSDRGRAELLSICKSLLQIDSGWRELELMARIGRSILGEAETEDVLRNLSVRAAAIGWDAALDEIEAGVLVDSLTDKQGQNSN